MQSEQQFCLRWNDHQSTLVTIFETLLESNILVDCTLAAEGQCMKAHKVVLSACSPYFQLLLSQHTDKHPIVILKDVKFEELRAMIDYMYRGEVNIPQDQLGPLLKAAESLQIRGLGVASNKDESGRSEKPLPLQKLLREKNLLSTERGTPSPPPQPLSSGAVGDAVQMNQGGVARKGSLSPTPRKRFKHLRSSNIDNDTQSQSSNSSEPLSQNQQCSTGEGQSVPPLAPLSVTNRISAPAKRTEWTEADAGKSSPLPTLPSTDEVPPLAPLSSFSTSSEDISRNREWPEAGMKRSSSPSTQNIPSGTTSIEAQKLVPVSEILLVPKTEYVEVEDDSLTNAMLDDVQDMEASGPSHADGSAGSAAFVPWLENMEGMAEDVGGQDMATAYRTSQDRLTGAVKTSSQRISLPEPGCCAHRCVENFGDSKKAEILAMMNSFASRDEKNAYLQTLIRIDRIKKPMPTLRRCSCKYFVRDGNMKIRVCKQAFMVLHGATDKQVRKICDFRLGGKPKGVRRIQGWSVVG